MWGVVWALIIGGVLGPDTPEYYFRSSSACYIAAAMQHPSLTTECLPKWVFFKSTPPMKSFGE